MLSRRSAEEPDAGPGTRGGAQEVRQQVGAGELLPGDAGQPLRGPDQRHPVEEHEPVGAAPARVEGALAPGVDAEVVEVVEVRGGDEQGRAGVGAQACEQAVEDLVALDEVDLRAAEGDPHGANANAEPRRNGSAAVGPDQQRPQPSHLLSQCSRPLSRLPRRRGGGHRDRQRHGTEHNTVG